MEMTLKEELEHFLLELPEFEGRFWWDGLSEEEGQVQWEAYTSTPEMQRYYAYTRRQEFRDSGWPIMVKAGVEAMIAYLDGNR